MARAYSCFLYEKVWGRFHLKYLPFIGNDDGGEGGAGEGDVVDGIDYLGEQQCVCLTLCIKGPLQDCKLNLPSWGYLSNIQTSYKAVIHGDKEDEHHIKQSQAYEKVVKAVLHFLHRKHKH